MSTLDEILATHNLSFNALQTNDGINQLDTLFVNSLPQEFKQQLIHWRSGKTSFSKIEESEFQICIGQYLNAFIAQTFGVSDETEGLIRTAKQHQALMDYKERFIQRGAKRYRQPIEGDFASHTDALLKTLNIPDIQALEDRLVDYALPLESGSNAEAQIIQWAYLAMNDAEGQQTTQDWVSFKLPERIDHTNLVPASELQFKGIPVKVGAGIQRRRDGFALTDQRMEAKAVASEINYCKYCHDHEGDFCSKGFPVRKSEPHLGLKKDPFGNTQTGCPLEEKISEMIRLEKEGLSIGALAMIMVENPMAPITGHRICNDCMKACIYQKQDPVNIPQIETRALTNVLDLPWGIEIYDLLMRWNPLKQSEFLPHPSTNRKVLVAGLGPAGFTMAHYLSQQGCHVVGIDGLKIEPLNPKLMHAPVRDWNMLEENLDERILMGFGGVAEYGITVRWDKNFLKLVYLTLARRHNIQFFGGVRLGGSLMLDDAFELGFDHVTMAVGAGLPRVLNIDNSLARGMRQASDFLMAMQLTGAAKETSLATLQVRLPAVVIGGGLTAIDTATEIQAYYIKQVEKVLHRVDVLGEEQVRQSLFTPEDDETLTEFLTHGREVRQERERALAANEAPNFTPLIHKWGGILLAYRRTMQESPAYTLNHEEIIKAFEEGIFYGENLNPQGVNLDKYGHIESINFLNCDQPITIPARAVLIAAGTSPNTIYATEHGQIDVEEQNHFQGYDLDGHKVPHDWNKHVKEDFAPFTSYNKHHHRVSYIGDTHPTFNGNVVKAITSAKRTADKIIEALAQLPPNTVETSTLASTLNEGLVATIESINTDNPTVAEVWVKAPFAAKNFKPGQFFRLQTFETDGQVVENTRLQIPLFTASGTGSKEGCIRLMVFQWGVAPRLIARLKKGDRIVLAGPTGAPTDLPNNKTILVIAGRWGAAVMLDIGNALRAAGNKVIYIGTFGQASDIDKMEDELEAGADQIIWCVQKGETIKARRPQDISIVESDMIALLKRLHGEGSVNMLEVDRLMAMGSTGLLKGLQKELSPEGDLVALFKPELEVTGMVGSPMQCMMKGVCGQCLQWQIDPITKKRTKAVFSCAEQDQNLKAIDLDNLTARTSQNRLLDTINTQWLSHIFEQMEQ